MVNKQSIMSEDIFYQYKNGNTLVTLLNDGTKIREYEGTPISEFPESIDIKITNYCDLACSFCFTPDMKVLTLNGKIDISEIKIGDKVYSFNFDKNIIELKEVDDIFIKKINEIIYVFELENGDIIKCTSEHELFTINRGWVKAKDILETDELKNIF